MKRIFLVAGGVLLVLLVALAVLPFLIPNSVYKTQIEKAATNALGREVTVSGDVAVSLLPSISASLKDVTVANPEGFGEVDMIKAGALRGSVKLFPLLSRRVEISELTFEDADVSLIRLENGDTNWNLGEAEEGAGETEPAETGGPFSASINRASLRNASLVYDDRLAGTYYELKEFDFETALRAPDKPLTAKAKGIFQDRAFSATLALTTPQSLSENRETEIEFHFGSDLGTTSFDGSVHLQDDASLDGAFDLNVPQISALTDYLTLDLPVNIAPLGALKASGHASGTLPDLTLRFEKLSVSGEGLDAGYTGTFSLADTMSLEGTANLTLRNAYALSQQMGLNLAQLAPIQQVSFNSAINGPINGLNFTQIDARTSSPQLKASYTGSLSLADKGTINGDVSAESSQLRTLLTGMGMAPSPGETLKSFRINGHATGSFNEIKLTNGTYKLDDTSASGTLGADLRGARPVLSADLTTDEMDLSPFLSQSSSSENAGDTSKGWSETPLDLEALKLVDADLTLKADKITVGAVSLENADLAALLENGRLSAVFNQFTAFDGLWSGEAVINAKPPVPGMDFNLSADNIAANTMLTTLAGFDKLKGTGAMSVDISSEGASISQIVNQLDGTLSLDLNDGALAGINLGQLVRSAGSLKESLAKDQLNLSSLGNAVSPQAETDFTSFETSLEVANGIGRIQSLTLINSVLNVDGAGQINLGGRTLDVKLTPAIDKTGQSEASIIQLNGVPVPLRISGSWMSPKFTPDFSEVISGYTGGETIEEAISGELESVLSDALSKPRQQPQKETSPEDAADEDNAAEEPTEEDPRERVLREALGGIFKEPE